MRETVGAALRRTVEALAEAGIDGAQHEARLLLAHALDRPPSSLVDRDQAIEADGLEALLARRVAHEPMAYILGRQGFWTLDLAVTPATLIPRADSETLIEAALEAFPDRGRVRHVLDLGTGSGCLLLAALSEFTEAAGVGVDISQDAALVALMNARECGLAGRAALLVGRWGDALAGRFDLIMSNPPYIETGDIPGLMPEVARHEPRLALDGGSDGLDAYRTILERLPALLVPGGRAFLELGAGQAAAVGTLAEQAGMRVEAIRPDLGGHLRAIVLSPGGKKRLA